MTQNFLELAKKGDPRVLAGLIHRALQSKGIIVKATQQADITHFLFECSQEIPEPEALTDYLIQALTRLKAPPLSLLVSVRKVGQREVAWQRRLSFDPEETLSLETHTASRNGGASDPVTPFDHNDDLVDHPPAATPNWEEDSSAAQGFGGNGASRDALAEQNTPSSLDLEGGDAAPMDVLDLSDQEETPGEWGQRSGAAVPSMSLKDEPEGAATESRSLSFFPFVTAAVVALLFALAGVGYRFIYYPQQQANNATEGTIAPNPDTVPSSPAPTGTEGTGTEGTGTEPTGTGTEGTGTEGTGTEGTGTEGTGTEPTGTEGTGTEGTGTEGTGTEGTEPTGEDPTVSNPSTNPSEAPDPSQVANPWYEGVNVAMEAAILTQTAGTMEEWETIAGYWDRAIELMAAVPDTDPNYAQAQERVTTYTTNRDYARQNAGL